ncbi:MAG: serine hydrolase [Caldilineae bacterium]|nr:serine hydrolase [Anaerolineae bacterium]MCB9154541.1 serine hydrolase [Caldilineae bacterium]
MMSKLHYPSHKRLILIAATACFILMAACGGGQPAAPALPASPAPVRDYWPTGGWRSDAPANRGLDEAALAGLRAQIEQGMPFLDSLLIVKDGYLVYEEYFNGYDADRLHPVHSVTKSVMSALFGVAQADGSIPNLDAKLGDALPDYFADGQHKDKVNITLRHLLQMRSGIQFDQEAHNDELAARGADAAEFFLGQDLTEYALGYPVAHAPGEAWNYSTLDSQLLSAAFSRLTGQSLADYAAESLFAAIGVGETVWSSDTNGVSIGGDTLELTPRDMAKFGYLYLNRGQWDGQQVIPLDWVNLSTSAQGDRAYYVPSGESVPIDFYGYHWWTWQPDWFHGHATSHARGFGGQWINVFSDLDLVIVSTANSQVDNAGNVAQEEAITAMIRDQILPALDIVQVEGE